jgi:class I fructose-bisphosphate aldolase
MTAAATIIIHNLAQAEAALAAATALGVPVRLMSARGAALPLGARVFAAIRDHAMAGFPQADARFVLDCGDHPGLVLAAFRLGIRNVTVRARPATLTRLADIARQVGGRIDEDGGAALDLADSIDAYADCRKWLAAAQKYPLPDGNLRCQGEAARVSGTSFFTKIRGDRGMKVTKTVKKILDNYSSDNPGTKANLARMLCTGRLGGTGKMVILPVDQGFEHGPHRSFAPNPAGYDPSYHAQLAVDAGLNAYASVLGMMEAVADDYAAQIPLILKVNSSNTLYRSKEAPTQAITASVDDAVRLGCAAIGYTIYPSSDRAFDMMEDLRELTAEAKSKGIAVVVWSYPRGGNLSKDGELAVDVGAYAAHMAALLGAHVIKVKLPSSFIEQDECKKVYEKEKIDISTQAARVRHVMDAAFKSKRIVVFSGGAMKGADAVYQDAQDIYDGGGNGQIIGRNTFQRPRDQAIEMLDRIISIFLGKTRHGG